MNFLDFKPITNSLLAFSLLGLGIINAIFISFVIGRVPPAKHPGFFRMAHRITGYIFLALYLFIGAVMFKKLAGFNMLPPKATIHSYIGISIFSLLLIKICINRFFKKFYSRLSVYGAMLLIAVYLQIPLYAGLYVYSAIKSKFVSVAGQGTVQSKSETCTISQSTSSVPSYKKWDDDIDIVCE